VTLSVESCAKVGEMVDKRTALAALASNDGRSIVLFPSLPSPSANDALRDKLISMDDAETSADALLSSRCDGQEISAAEGRGHASYAIPR
jgi:hypothetical protein